MAEDFRCKKQHVQRITCNALMVLRCGVAERGWSGEVVVQVGRRRSGCIPRSTDDDHLRDSLITETIIGKVLVLNRWSMFTHGIIAKLRAKCNAPVARISRIEPLLRDSHKTPFLVLPILPMATSKRNEGILRKSRAY
jgi:hypothetical protein